MRIIQGEGSKLAGRENSESICVCRLHGFVETYAIVSGGSDGVGGETQLNWH